jgi:hypothetical protein
MADDPVAQMLQAMRGGGAARPAPRAGGGDPVAQMVAAMGAKPGGSLSVLAQPKPRSLLEQLKQPVTGLPGGLGGLAKLAYREATHGGPMALAADPKAALAAYRRAEGSNPFERLKVTGREIAPFSTAIAESFQSTGQDVLHPTRFAQAVREGRIVDKILEDVGNVALVAGPLAKGISAGAESGATAARIAEEASAASRAAEAAGQTGRAAQAARTAADAEAVAGRLGTRVASRLQPLVPALGRVEHPYRTLAAGVGRGVGRVAEGDSLLAPLARPVVAAGEGVAARVEPLSSRVRDRAALLRARADLSGSIERETNELLPRQLEGFVKAAAVDAPEHVQAAAILEASGRVRPLAPLLEAERAGRVSAGTFARAADEALNDAATPIKGRVSEEAATLAAELVLGTAPADVVEQVARIREGIGEAQAFHERQQRAGFGWVSGERLSPDQLADRPLPAVVEERAAPRRAVVDKAQEAARAAEQRAGEAGQARAQVEAVEVMRLRERAAGHRGTVEAERAKEVGNLRDLARVTKSKADAVEAWRGVRVPPPDLAVSGPLERAAVRTAKAREAFAKLRTRGEEARARIAREAAQGAEAPTLAEGAAVVDVPAVAELQAQAKELRTATAGQMRAQAVDMEERVFRHGKPAKPLKGSPMGDEGEMLTRAFGPRIWASKGKGLGIDEWLDAVGRDLGVSAVDAVTEGGRFSGEARLSAVMDALAEAGTLRREASALLKHQAGAGSEVAARAGLTEWEAEALRGPLEDVGARLQAIESEARGADVSMPSAAERSTAALASAEGNALAALAARSEEGRPLFPRAPTAPERAIYAEGRGGERVARAEGALGQARESVLGRAFQQGQRAGVREGKGLAEAQALRARERALTGQAGAVEAGAVPSTPAARQAALKASLLEQRAGRIERGAATVVADSGPVTQARVVAKEAEAAAAAARRRVATAQAGLDRAVKRAEASVSAAPAKYRPALQAAHRGAEALREMAKQEPAAAAVLLRLAEEMPADLERLRASGDTAQISHVLGGVFQDVPRTPKIRPDVAASPMARLAAEHVRTQQTHALTVQDLAQVYGADARKAVGNRVAGEFTGRLGRAVEDVAPDAVGLKGQALTEAMGRAGWSHSSEMFGTAGGKGDRWLPTAIVKEFKLTFADPSMAERAARQVDRWVTTPWKVANLPLNPHWQIGNLVGNSMMAMVGGGLNPAELVGGMVRGRRELGLVALPEELAGKNLPQRVRTHVAALLKESAPVEGSVLATPEGRKVMGSSLTSEVADLLSPRTSKPHGRVYNAGRGTIRFGYRLNGLIDNLTRSAVLFTKLDEGLPLERAARDTLKVMGNYADATAFERRVVKRVLPFWPWVKHSTALTFRLPVEHPLRVAMTLHLADLASDPDSGLPEWLAGAIPLGGGRYLPTGGLNPFDQVAAPIFTPSGLGRSLSPAIRLPLEVMNMRPDKQQLLSAPAGYEKDGAGFIGVKPALYRLAGSTAPTRLLRDLPGEPVARFDTGQPILKGGRTISAAKPGGKLGALAAYATGAPRPIDYDTEAAARRAAKADKAAAKSRASYEQRRKIAALGKPVKR